MARSRSLTLGNASSNNLLKTMQSAHTSLVSYQDQAAAYDWDLSAKTDADLKQYEDYINGRIGTVQNNPSEALTLNKKLVDANRTYTSAEVGRQTVQVLYGAQSNVDKYHAIQRLMDRAASNGDASLVQTLDSTRARLSETIQNEQTAAANKAASNAKKAATAGVTTNKNANATALSMLEGAYQQGKPLTNPDGSPIKVQYANGKPVLDQNGNITPDPNGQPLQLDGRTYAALKGHLLKVQEGILKNDITQNGDDTGSKQESLTKLQNSTDYQNFATDERMQRYYDSNGGINPFVTKVKSEIGPDGKPILTRTVGDAPTTERMVPDGKGGFTTELVPVTGTIGANAQGNGGSFIFDSKIGSSPDSPMDRTQNTLRTTDLGQGPVGLSSAAGGGTFGGYGQQNSFVNPNQNALPNGKPRAASIYVKDGIHSVAPLKLDANGNPVTTTAKDFPQAPVSLGDGHLLAQDFINELTGTGPSSLGQGLQKFGADVRQKGALDPIGQAVGLGITGIGRLADYGAKLKAESAQKAAIAAAAEAAQNQARITAVQNAANAARQAQAPAASYSSTFDKVNNVPGAPAVPAAVIKASNTPGTRQFTEKYLPAAKILGI